MITRPCTQLSWKVNGGYSHNSTRRASFIKASRLCPSPRGVRLHYPTLKQVKITRTFRILPVSICASKIVIQPALFLAFIAFPLKDQPNRRLVAWTTTPWTLPSNLALCVHPDLDYVAVKPKGSDVENVVLECLLKSLYKKPADYTVVEKFKGSTLKGKQYIPPFTYFEHLDTGKFFHVLTGTFVTTDQGTGIVHQAPYFGEVSLTL